MDIWSDDFPNSRRLSPDFPFRRPLSAEPLPRLSLLDLDLVRRNSSEIGKPGGAGGYRGGRTGYSQARAGYFPGGTGYTQGRVGHRSVGRTKWMYERNGSFREMKKLSFFLNERIKKQNE